MMRICTKSDGIDIILTMCEKRNGIILGFYVIKDK